MIKSFRIEVKDSSGSWLTVFADKDNYQRLRRVDFVPVETTAVRLVAESAHGESKAHIFSFEVK